MQVGITKAAVMAQPNKKYNIVSLSFLNRNQKSHGNKRQHQYPRHVELADPE